jgi:hypothetical protein
MALFLAEAEAELEVEAVVSVVQISNSNKQLVHYNKVLFIIKVLDLNITGVLEQMERL